MAVSDGAGANTLGPAGLPTAGGEIHAPRPRAPRDDEIPFGPARLRAVPDETPTPPEPEPDPHPGVDPQTARRLAHYEATFAAIEELACAPAQPSLLLELCVERARALVRASGAAVQLLDEGDELLFAAVSGSLRDHLGTVQSIIGTLCGAAISTGEVVWSRDAQADLRGDRKFASATGIRSAVSLPLTQDRRQIGVLLVCGDTVDQFTEEDVELLRRLARVASARLDYALARDARRRTEQTLDASRQKYRTVLGAIEQGILVIDDYDRIALVNPAAERILGQPTYDLIGKRPTWLLLSEDGKVIPQRDWPVNLALREGRQVRETTMQVVRSDGDIRWVTSTASPLPAAEDGRRGAMVCFTDITDSRNAAERLRDSERLLAETQRLAHIGSWDWDITRGHVTWTDEMYQLFGLAPQSTRINPDMAVSLAHPDDQHLLRNALDHSLRTGEPLDLTARVVLGTGRIRQLHFTGEVVLGPNGPVRVWGSAQDVTERLEVQDTLRRMALTDSLTGLGNRLHLVERLRSGLARLATVRTHLTVIAIDLDGLKAVNDQYGHAAGDDLLRETAHRLRAAVRDSDTVARQGGDEFVLVCVGVGPAGAQRLAERIVHDISAEYRLPGGPIAWAGASVGVTVTDDPNADPDRLLARADQAMYAAKGAGGRRYVLDPAGFGPFAG